MDWDPVIQALLIGTPSVVITYLVYRRSLKVDAVSAQSGAVTESRAGTAQILEGYLRMIDNLQEDNTSFREDLRHLRARLDEITRERDELRAQLNRLIRRYGDEHTPPSTPITE